MSNSQTVVKKTEVSNWLRAQKMFAIGTEKGG
jgi:hypothetical protein